MLHILADLGFGDVTQAIESDTKILYKDGYGFVCDDGKAEIRLVSLISAALVQK